MVFEYTVKYNGRTYYPGEDVPMEETEKTEIVDSVDDFIENVVLGEQESAPVKKADEKKKGRRKPKE